MTPHRQQAKWLPEQDAILCDAIADGLSFSKAGLAVGRTKGCCISRFHFIARQFGWQAA